ncbi:ATP-binding protein [uncultured Bacteroides sp.]|uniref:sensor histidine kinase n=1 Tax=uncultured Bacteroides sp. TaxID=162156 RepID=UPI0025D4A5AC|nr:ATP-binding protein [uncultured Bacteroides sp.]
MKIYQRKLLLTISLLVVTYLTVSANNKDYVLILNSINLEEGWVKNFDTELKERFKSEKDLELKSYLLSVPLLKSEDEVKQLQERVLKTYPIPPKVVLIVGDPGWLVCASLFDGPWKNVPIILCYSRNRVPKDLNTLLTKAILTDTNSIPIEDFNKHYNITVLRQPYFIVETLKLIKHLQPGVRRIALISDYRYISVVTQNSIKKIIKEKYPTLTFENLSSSTLSTEQLLDTLGSYNQETGVIYYSWIRPYTNKNSFYLSDHLKKILPTFLSTPVFTLADLNLHENLYAGGYYISASDFTDTAMSIIHRVMNGETASSIPYQDGGTPHTYLNYADLQWCNIPENLYPNDAIYYFKPPTFYQKYATYIWMSCIFILLLIALYLYLSNRSKNAERKIKKELIKAKEHAEESDRLKSAFLANMSHEIRTPLNAIVGFSSILAETAYTEENKEYIHIIENNNHLLLQLINDILDLSRIEAGSLDFEYRNVNINHCLKELANVFRLRMPPNVNCLIDTPLSECIVYIEKNRVMQILSNYISNAIKYTIEGSITIGYHLPESNKLRLFIRDTGCGIAADKCQLVFERFVKLDSFKQGTGLGLSICRMLAEKMNGTVGVHSKVGEGTEFWLELPYQHLTETSPNFNEEIKTFS